MAGNVNGHGGSDAVGYGAYTGKLVLTPAQ